MPCERYASTLADAAAGGVVTAEVEAHLGSCASCRAELATLREALGLADAELRTIASAEPSPSLQARIRRAVAEEDASATTTWRWLWPAMAAALLLLAVAAGLWRVGGLAPPPRIAAATLSPTSTAPSPPEPSAASRAADVSPRGAAPIGQSPRGAASASGDEGSARATDSSRHVSAASLGTTRPRRRLPAEPEVLVPPGQQEALLRFVALVHREHLAPRSLMAAGEPSADLVEPKSLQIQPLEIVPLDPAESSGT
jgi:hypothetical protein